MDVSLCIFWTIDLNNPVHGGEVQPPGSDICREQDSVLRLGKFVERRESRHLLLLPMQVHQRHARVHLTERLVHEPDLLATGEEHENFRLKVSLDEAPEGVEFLVKLDHCVVLFEGGWGNLFSSRGYVDRVLQAQASEVRDGFRLGGGEE